MPSLAGAWGIWVPILERSSFMSVGWGGGCFGVCATLPFAGYIADVFNWESVFYISGDNAYTCHGSVSMHRNPSLLFV